MARQAAVWADGVLPPLARHEAPAAQRPGRRRPARHPWTSWLATRRGAGERLGIHRNTLSGRLRLVERLAGRDLARVDDRAELSLALRVRALVRHGASDAFGAVDPGRPDRPLGAPRGTQRRVPHGGFRATSRTGCRSVCPRTAGVGARRAASARGRHRRAGRAHAARLAGPRRAPRGGCVGLVVERAPARQTLVRIGGVLGLDLLPRRTRRRTCGWRSVSPTGGSPVLADEENRRAS
ncbi:helix-turn-helix domain-containing protein [Yinghuangia aomiensis]